ncbi:DUF6528 family protein [Streptomyces mobaraensis]|uniref:DUF6528 family protein n=1 Tax=Streptomyces mobaraensis TaxID=35621 RepID=UPI003327A6C9
MERRSLLRAAVAGAVGVPMGARLSTGTASAAPAPAPASYRVLVTRVDGTTDSIMEFDRTAPSFTAAHVRWRLRPGWGDVLEARYRTTAHDGQVVLVAAGDSPSQGRAGIYRKSDKKLLWSVPVHNYPHSIELVRDNGAVVVAGAGTKRPDDGAPRPGGGLHLYTTGNGRVGSLAHVASYPLVEAHGVLWDPEYKLLWAIGRTEICRFRLVGSGSGVRLREEGRRVRIGGNGHDLQPDYTDRHRLLLTDTHHVYALDKRTLKPTPLPGPLGNTQHVKSIVRHQSGEYVWAGVPKGSSSHFGGPEIHFHPPADSRTCGKGTVTYKARIAVPAYQ